MAEALTLWSNVTQEGSDWLLNGFSCVTRRVIKAMKVKTADLWLYLLWHTRLVGSDKKIASPLRHNICLRLLIASSNFVELKSFWSVQTIVWLFDVGYGVTVVL